MMRIKTNEFDLSSLGQERGILLVILWTLVDSPVGMRGPQRKYQGLINKMLYRNILSNETGEETFLRSNRPKEIFYYKLLFVL